MPLRFVKSQHDPCIRVLSRRDVRLLLPMSECIEVMQKALVQTARHGATLQLRRTIMALPNTEGAVLGLMPGSMAEPNCFGAKVTSVYPSNFGSGLLSHQGTFTLFERGHGRPLAVLHGGEITGIRTAAASAVATRILARSDATSLALIGYGEQAALHLCALRLVRNIERVVVWGRHRDRARAFADAQRRLHGINVETAPSVESAVQGADIICTATSAHSPILYGRDLQQGCHLNVVGASVATHREIDTEAVLRSRYFVDNRQMALAEAGEYLLAAREGSIDEGHILGEIGEVLAGVCPGRRECEDITVYRSLGMPVEDLASAMHVYTKAEKHGVGVLLEF